MSMTREEAIKSLKNIVEYWTYKPTEVEAAKMAIAALLPVSREQVEKSWAGCAYCEKHKINLVRIEMNYDDSPGSTERLNPTRAPKFCPICGRPLTDEAVDMVMERMEGGGGR